MEHHDTKHEPLEGSAPLELKTSWDHKLGTSCTNHRTVPGVPGEALFVSLRSRLTTGGDRRPVAGWWSIAILTNQPKHCVKPSEQILRKKPMTHSIKLSTSRIAFGATLPHHRPRLLMEAYMLPAARTKGQEPQPFTSLTKGVVACGQGRLPSKKRTDFAATFMLKKYIYCLLRPVLQEQTVVLEEAGKNRNSSRCFLLLFQQHFVRSSRA